MLGLVLLDDRRATLASTVFAVSDERSAKPSCAEIAVVAFATAVALLIVLLAVASRPL